MPMSPGTIILFSISSAFSIEGNLFSFQSLRVVDAADLNLIRVGFGFEKEMRCLVGLSHDEIS